MVGAGLVGDSLLLDKTCWQVCGDRRTPGSLPSAGRTELSLAEVQEEVIRDMFSWRCLLDFHAVEDESVGRLDLWFSLEC